MNESGLNKIYFEHEILPPTTEENIVLNPDAPKDIGIEVDKNIISESLLTNLDLKDQQATLENIIKEASLSTSHLSGSYLEQGTLLSLDDIVIISLQSSTPTSTEFQGNIMSSARVSLPHVTSTNVTSENSSSHKPSSTETSDNVVVIPLESTAIASYAFSKHLFVPQPLEKSDKNILKPRVPASISSLAWRKHYEEKEKIKHEKNRNIVHKA